MALHLRSSKAQSSNQSTPPLQMQTRSSSKSSFHDQQPKIIKMDRQIQNPAAKIILIFPEEIIAEILSRLPVKSLLKFRCVSKSWRSLISSKHFIEAHLKISTKDSNFTRRKIISTTLSPGYSVKLKECSLESLLSGSVSDSVDLDYPMESRNNGVGRLVGCCNGLVCIVCSGDQFFLWNPSTRNYKKLPDADNKINRGVFIARYGFGFDEFNGDYKVLGVLCGFCPAFGYEDTVKIYSMRTNSWKTIDIFNDGLPCDQTGKFVSGKLHWGRSRISGLNSQWDIVYFDLGSEKCGKLEQPRYHEGGFTPTLGVLGDCLCVLCDYPQANVDVWILKDYDVKDSWVKLVSIPCISGPWRGPYSSPLCFGTNGQIILVYESRFVVYNLKENRSKLRKVKKFDAFVEAYVYFESLVSI